MITQLITRDLYPKTFIFSIISQPRGRWVYRMMLTILMTEILCSVTQLLTWEVWPIMVWMKKNIIDRRNTTSGFVRSFWNEAATSDLWMLTQLVRNLMRTGSITEYLVSITDLVSLSRVTLFCCFSTSGLKKSWENLFK